MNNEHECLNLYIKLEERLEWLDAHTEENEYRTEKDLIDFLLDKILDYTDN